MGGLTSQMHKYALGRVLSLKYNVPLKLDLTWFDNPKSDTPWEYQLDYFNINATIATVSEIKKLKGNNLFNRIARKIEKFFSIRIYKKSYINKSFISISDFHKLKSDIYLDGEWNGFKYFEDYQDTIKNELTLKRGSSINIQNTIKELKSSDNSVFLHIRRGDYLSNKNAAAFHAKCSLDYYYKAIQIVKEKIDNPIFYIFSDDILWVKKNFVINESCRFMEKNQNFEDLLLMSYCKHGITANSGFSLMAGWLNQNKDKMIIVPQTWVNDDRININILNSLEQDNFTIIR